MTISEQEALFVEITDKMKELLLKKGNDYSNEDRLSNFKKVAAMVNTTPELACLNLVAVKVARLGELLQKGRIANNESIDDSIVDLQNYSVLLAMIRHEQLDVQQEILQKIEH